MRRLALVPVLLLSLLGFGGGAAAADNLKDGDYEDIAVTNSTFANSTHEGLGLEVRGYPGDSVTYTNNPATLDSFAATGNTVIDNGGPGFTLNNRPTIDSITVEGNRIAAPRDACVLLPSRQAAAAISKAAAAPGGAGSIVATAPIAAGAR